MEPYAGQWSSKVKLVHHRSNKSQALTSLNVVTHFGVGWGGPGGQSN